MKPWTVAVSVAGAVAVAAAGTVGGCTFPTVTFAGDASMGVDATSDSGGFPETSAVDVFINTEAGCVDLDDDTYNDMFTSCEGGNDCNDTDLRIHPRAGDPFSYEIPDSGNLMLTLPNGDWNCDGKVTQQYPTTLSPGQCTGVTCNAANMPGFQTYVACGESGWFGHCQQGIGCAYVDGGLQVQGCK